MQVRYYSASTLEDVFRRFKFTLNEDEIDSVHCLAHEGITNDEVTSLYEIRFKNGEYRFFGVIELDQVGDEDEEKAFILDWARAKDVTTLEVTDTNYLFELKEPFSIHYSE